MRGERYLFEPSPARTALEVTCFPLTAKGALAKAGTEVVNTKTFYFSDISQSGLARVDGSVIYLPFEEAQVLCGMAGAVKRASAIHVKFKHGVNLEQGCDKVRAMWQKFVEAKAGAENAQLLKQVRVESWKEYRREVIAAMEKEQVMVTFMFAPCGNHDGFYRVRGFLYDSQPQEQGHRNTQEHRGIERQCGGIIFMLRVSGRDSGFGDWDIGRMGVFEIYQSDRRRGFTSISDFNCGTGRFMLSVIFRTRYRRGFWRL